MAKNQLTWDRVCSPTIRRYGFWTLIAVLAALTVHDVYVLVEEYLENPRQVDMNVVFNQTITMPNVTVCTSMRQWSAFFKVNSTLAQTWDDDLAKSLKKYKTKDDFLKKEWSYQMTAEGMMVIMSLTSMEIEIITEGVARTIHALPRDPRLHAKNMMINDWMHRINELEISYEDFRQKVGKEILKKGLHRMRRISPDENDVFVIDHKITWISNLNFCFQPVFQTEEPIKSQGQFLFFQIKMDLDKMNGLEDIKCMTVDFHGRPSDEIRYMGGPAAAKDGVAENLCPGEYAEIRAEVKATYDMLENDSPGRSCEDLTSNGKNDYDCKLQCRIEFIRSLCSCTPVSLAYLADSKELNEYPICNYTTCTINPKTIDLATEPKCKEDCKRDCHQTRYKITRSNAKKQLALNELYKEYVSNDLTTVSLTWGSFEYLSLEQDWKYTPVSFAAALGGAIGIYLGLSVLTVIVGLAYGCDVSYKYLTGYYKDRRQSRRVKNTKNSESNS
ncbi:hypothetical protein M3Y94_00980600 [Aphelenchoides besseyi]|nr:hypothetical protein M3Y94_00980600 [Aphelenchoides besseyi]KAI6221059.1 Amiloride-sensitive sodium channel subunit beta [Aphelenchoides besseyi]